ncbi:hypothetical protein [Yersinia phage fHe-Yen9-03]|uniref:CMP/dCMP-type deaminase domain-containing protein n=1 Tax=Yersinia phage fHe-Yen9-03 TaxID=2052743 RepID=A0A2C9CYJ1_9CAUD|nr:hypothetical protein [Yersinia phage fHe-Yen9-03]
MKISKLIGILNNMPIKKKSNTTRKHYTIIACALDKKGRVLSMRTNDYNCSHPLQKHYAEKVGRPEAIFLHAEVATLIAARKEVYKLLIARIDVKGNPLPAKPCQICEKAIAAFGVKEIEYT